MSLLVTEYTDAVCPWAWSAEPMRWRLRWLYGDGLRVAAAHDRARERPRRVRSAAVSRPRAWPPAMRTSPRDTACRWRRRRARGSAPRCRRAAPSSRRGCTPLRRSEALLRRLRVHAMTRPSALLDDELTIARAAHESGINPAELERWCADPAVERALAEDMDASRPLAAGSGAAPQARRGARTVGDTRRLRSSSRAPTAPRSTRPASSRRSPTRSRSRTSTRSSRARAARVGRGAADVGRGAARDAGSCGGHGAGARGGGRCARAPSRRSPSQSGRDRFWTLPVAAERHAA